MRLKCALFTNTRVRAHHAATEEHRRLDKQVLGLEEAKKTCLRELNDPNINREQEKIKHGMCHSCSRLDLILIWFAF